MKKWKTRCKQRIGIYTDSESITMLQNNVGLLVFLKNWQNIKLNGIAEKTA